MNVHMLLQRRRKKLCQMNFEFVTYQIEFGLLQSILKNENDEAQVSC